jgi:hypothetical protein
MDLTANIETAFAHRQIPSEVVETEGLLQIDSDVEEALWFEGRDWRTITCDDWRKHSCAVFFFSPEAFAYYLPSLLTVTVQDPKGYPDLAVGSLIGLLDHTPAIEFLDDYLIQRFSGLNDAEFKAIKEWLLFACENLPGGSGIAASGAGEVFGRAFDTVALLQEEAQRRRALDQEIR